MSDLNNVRIRKFDFKDIKNKVEWINDPNNNKYLHYDLPLEYKKTCDWFEKNKDNINRFDAVIEVDGLPVGIVGLLSIDYKNKKCEEYITIGRLDYKRKGIATKALQMICRYGFENLGLNKIVAYVEYGNPSLYLHTKVGFQIEGFLKNDLLVDSKYIDRFILGLTRDDFIFSDGKGTGLNEYTNI